MAKNILVAAVILTIFLFGIVRTQSDFPFSRSFRGACRFGSDNRNRIGSNPNTYNARACYKECRDRNDCVAFSYQKYDKYCEWYRGGPYTYGNGNDAATCYIMNTGFGGNRGDGGGGRNRNNYDNRGSYGGDGSRDRGYGNRDGGYGGRDSNYNDNRGSYGGDGGRGRDYGNRGGGYGGRDSNYNDNRGSYGGDGGRDRGYGNRGSGDGGRNRNNYDDRGSYGGDGSRDRGYGNRGSGYGGRDSNSNDNRGSYGGSGGRDRGYGNRGGEDGTRNRYDNGNRGSFGVGFGSESRHRGSESQQVQHTQFNIQIDNSDNTCEDKGEPGFCRISASLVSGVCTSNLREARRVQEFCRKSCRLC